ncbi:hypothetical protein LEP1GSC058_2520 [Leptospira fainei serovar Hurstbridge str. BUT 6]|uniref:Uncharacterized protein n=1 Tax=Leptospira fainei serovar Hurstbridge str. BUT 6 TaxID=1193011 RepID=S3UVZ4_9LEPT|nr:hypothetical protein LEP1GSC058_2520 [Leptospira fainei serovar Hurstbridge str. BUT 6]
MYERMPKVNRRVEWTEMFHIPRIVVLVLASKQSLKKLF